MGLRTLGAGPVPVLFVGVVLAAPSVGAVTGAAQEGPAQKAPVLESARIDAVLSPEGAAARVRLGFDLGNEGPDQPLTLLAIASPQEIVELEVGGPNGWVALPWTLSQNGRLEASVSPEIWGTPGGSGLQLRYLAPLAQMRRSDGAVVGLRIPVLAPLGVRGDAGSGAVEIAIRSVAPLELSVPFPSTLGAGRDGGTWTLAGSAPAVPGVVRFGRHDPASAGVPTELPGGVFWGLWFALGGLLLFYVLWVRGVERRERSPAVQEGGDR